jgi:hypothetical protein
MDVDNMEINSLTKEERDKYMKKGLCFYCKGTGHVSCNCPKKKGKNQNSQQGGNWRRQNPPPPTVRAAQTEEQPKIEEVKELDLKELAKHFKQLSQEEQDTIFESILTSLDF